MKLTGGGGTLWRRSLPGPRFGCAQAGQQSVRATSRTLSSGKASRHLRVSVRAAHPRATRCEVADGSSGRVTWPSYPGRS
jgi:hypothetical protein